MKIKNWGKILKNLGDYQVYDGVYCIEGDWFEMRGTYLHSIKHPPLMWTNDMDPNYSNGMEAY